MGLSGSIDVTGFMIQIYNTGSKMSIVWADITIYPKGKSI